MASRQTYSSRRRLQPYPLPSSRTTSPEPDDKAAATITKTQSIKRAPLKSLGNQSLKSRKKSAKPKLERKGKEPMKGGTTLTQLFFDVQSTTKSCHLCGLSYTAGVPDDERLHKRHCSRVNKGLQWTKEEERDGLRASYRIIEEFLHVRGSKEKARIIAVDCNGVGRIGSKVGVVSSSPLELTHVVLRFLPSLK